MHLLERSLNKEFSMKLTKLPSVQSENRQKCPGEIIIALTEEGKVRLSVIAGKYPPEALAWMDMDKDQAQQFALDILTETGLKWYELENDEGTPGIFIELPFE